MVLLDPHNMPDNLVHLVHQDLQDAQETQGRAPLDHLVPQVHKVMEDQDPKEKRAMQAIHPALGAIILHNQDHQDHLDLLARRDHKDLKGIKVNQDSQDLLEDPEALRECQLMEEYMPFQDPLVHQDLLDHRDHRDSKETLVHLASLAPHEATSLSALALLGLQVLLGLQACQDPRLHPRRCASTSMTI